jgi:S1-C subfamily serine protease
VQNFIEAAKWFRAAAEQGDAAAQYDLGFMCAQGKGVRKDFVEAYKWYSLAAAQNETNALAKRDLISVSMTPLDVAEGQRLAREFVVSTEGGASNQGDRQDSALIGTLPRFTGAGFFVTDDGWLMTSYHVVASAARIEVRTKAGTFPAMLVKADKSNDLALLKASGNFSALPVASSRGVKPGAAVFTIGFPVIDVQGFAPKVTQGTISGLGGAEDDPREFQINIAARPGYAGGPLLNGTGNVIGMVEAPVADNGSLDITASLPQNSSYVVRSSLLNALLESLPNASGLKEANTTDEKFEQSAKEAENAIALVLVY